MDLLPVFKKGSGPNVLLASTWNRFVVEPINAMLKLEVVPAGAGRFIWGKEKSILDLTALAKRVGLAGGLTPFGMSDVSAGGADLVQVSTDSWLMKSKRPADKMTITGLGSPLAISAGKWVALKGVFEGLEMTTASIEVVDPFDAPVVFDTPGADNKVQIEAWRPIGYVFAAADARLVNYPSAFSVGGLKVVQVLESNLLICETCFEKDTVYLFEDYSHKAYIAA